MENASLQFLSGLALCIVVWQTKEVLLTLKQINQRLGKIERWALARFPEAKEWL